MSDLPYNLKWEDLAFTSKKDVNNLKATFIAAPRQLSDKRLSQIVKAELPKGNVIIGIATEDYIDGFEDQDQFRTLKLADTKQLLEYINPKLDAQKIANRIYTLTYSQKETAYIYDKLKFRKVVLVNGSWLNAYHTRNEYYRLLKRAIPYKFVSPFCDEEEAKAFVHDHANTNLQAAIEMMKSIPQQPAGMLAIADMVAKLSYDYMFQTGSVLGKLQDDKYKVIVSAYNKVVPYQTYAMHHGASRETNMSPPNDLNHYDTVHAEVELIITAQRHQIDLKGTTLFINLMPCPPCSRMLAETDIAEIVYQFDHSEGYAVKMLEAAGKKVTRIVV